MSQNTITQTSNHTALATQHGNIYYFPPKDLDGITDIKEAIQQNQNQIDRLSFNFLREKIKTDTVTLLANLAAIIVIGSCALIVLCAGFSADPVAKELFIMPATFLAVWVYLCRLLRKTALVRNKSEAQLSASNEVRQELYKQQELVALKANTTAC